MAHIKTKKKKKTKNESGKKFDMVDSLIVQKKQDDF